MYLRDQIILRDQLIILRGQGGQDWYLEVTRKYDFPSKQYFAVKVVDARSRFSTICFLFLGKHLL